MYSQKSAITKRSAALSDGKTNAKVNFMLNHMNTDVKLDISAHRLLRFGGRQRSGKLQGAVAFNSWEKVSLWTFESV
jgi:hypothetical protein